ETARDVGEKVIDDLAEEHVGGARRSGTLGQRAPVGAAIAAPPDDLLARAGGHRLRGRDQHGTDRFAASRDLGQHAAAHRGGDRVAIPIPLVEAHTSAFLPVRAAISPMPPTIAMYGIANPICRYSVSPR